MVDEWVHVEDSYPLFLWERLEDQKSRRVMEGEMKDEMEADELRRTAEYSFSRLLESEWAEDLNSRLGSLTRLEQMLHPDSLLCENENSILCCLRIARLELNHAQSQIRGLYVTSKKAISAVHQNLGPLTRLEQMLRRDSLVYQSKKSMLCSLLIGRLESNYDQSLIRDLCMASKKAISAIRENLGSLTRLEQMLRRDSLWCESENSILCSLRIARLELNHAQSQIRDLCMTSKKAISAVHQNLGDNEVPHSSRGAKRLLDDHEVSASLFRPHMSSLPNHSDSRNIMASEAEGQRGMHPLEDWIEEESPERGSSKIRKVEGGYCGLGTDEGLWGRTPLGKKLEADLAAKAKAGHFSRFTTIPDDEPEQTEWSDQDDQESSGTESSPHLQPSQSELVQTEWNEYDDDASSGTESSSTCSNARKM